WPPGPGPGRAAHGRGDLSLRRTAGPFAGRIGRRLVQGDGHEAGAALGLRDGCRAPRLVLLREAKEQRVQRGALLLVERREELVLDLPPERPQLPQGSLSVLRQLDMVAAAVVGVAVPLDETALLELVEEADELALVVPEPVRDPA